MDNNEFNNGFYGSEPQKPFTERQDNNTVPTEQTPQQEPTVPQDFLPADNEVNEPEEKMENQVTDASNGGQNINDYNDGFGQPNTYQGGYYKQGYPQQNIYPQSAYQQNNNRQCYNPNGCAQGNYTPNMQNMYAPNGYNNQQNFQPYQQMPPQPNFNVQMPYAPMPQKQPAKKMGGGLIVLIVALSVLLVGSIIGLIVYAVNSNNNNTNRNNLFGDNGNSFTIPYNYGNGGDIFGTQPETTAPAVHEDSDYSDKINKNYGGLKLEDKPKDANDRKYTAESAFNNVSDSVVGIVCYTGDITTVENCSSQGSGIIISSDGYVLTNSHVINNSKTAYLIQIVTSDGKEYTAGVVGFDSRTDIAVLKMDDAKDLKPATFGDSSKIELGEDIIAVGNPGGLDYQNSITKGIVSALNRELSSTSLVKYIQTDAAINPGNSGGPVVNLYGQVIGVATSKIVSEQYEGMGFAIPSQTVKEIVDELVRNGYVAGRVKIGITGVNVTASMASQYNVPQGIMVAEIVEGGPCDGTGLMTDDIITEADGQEVKTFSDIYEVLEKHKTGDKIKLKYYRASDDSEGTVEVILQEDK